MGLTSPTLSNCADPEEARLSGRDRIHPGESHPRAVSRKAAVFQVPGGSRASSLQPPTPLAPPRSFWGTDAAHGLTFLSSKSTVKLSPRGSSRAGRFQ